MSFNFVCLKQPVLFAGLALWLGACSASAPPTYDLTTPADVATARRGRAQLIVAEPTAVQVLDSERILVRPADGEVSYLPDAQWSDRLPRLMQARIIQTFENAHRLASVGRPADKLLADATLITEIRAFEIAADSNEAVVEISAKLVNERSGRIMAARVFSARQPGAPAGQKAASALDAASQTALRDLVAWAASRI